MMTVIETARCYVREFSVSCIPEVFRLYEGEHFTDYIEPLLSVEEETEYRENYIKKIYGKYGYGMWDVFDKETGRLIGEAGLEHRTDSDREKFPYDWMFDEHCAELGYCIANARRSVRRSFVTEQKNWGLKFSLPERREKMPLP